MSKGSFDRYVLTDASWWHWTLTIPLLAAHLAGQSAALVAAMGLCAVAGGTFWLRLRSIRPYAVQVRIAYLGLLAIGTLPWMGWLHWVQLAGTTAMVTVGYCPLIRLLSLLRFNRTVPLSASYLGYVFFRRPCAGGMIQWAGTPSVGAIHSCSAPGGGGVPMTCSVPRVRRKPQELQHA